jgi:hypothetical protein
MHQPQQDRLSQLNDLYNQVGWSHLESYIENQIKSSQRIIKTRTAPTKEVDFARGEVLALEALLDKVESDKQALTSRQK